MVVLAAAAVILAEQAPATKVSNASKAGKKFPAFFNSSVASLF